MEFQNWPEANNGIPKFGQKIGMSKNGISKLDSGQKWNSKIGPLDKNGIPKLDIWPKMEFQNWTFVKNGIPKLDPSQK